MGSVFWCGCSNIRTCCYIHCVPKQTRAINQPTLLNLLSGKALAGCFDLLQARNSVFLAIREAAAVVASAVLLLPPPRPPPPNAKKAMHASPNTGDCASNQLRRLAKQEKKEGRTDWAQESCQ
jgi:hypothetical protein